jgi:AraC family transcriptional activator of pobA
MRDAGRDQIAFYSLSPAADGTASRGLELLRPVAWSVAAPDTGTPHRHEYQEIILVESGRAMHTIDGRPRVLQPGTAAVIEKGRVHLMLLTERLTGWIIRFTDDFLPSAEPDALTETVRGLFNPLTGTPELTLPAPEQAELGQLLSLMESEYARPEGQRRELVLRHLLAALLLRLDRYRTDQPADERRALPEYRLYQDFLLELERAFRTEHGVAYYADALNLSPERLSRALNRAVGKSAKQLIGERSVLEAKRLITYTTLSMKEIAASLGYSDQFRFSKAFKRQTGLLPQAFREEWRKVT